MSNKTELQSNNTDLQGILDTISALPEAGGGANVATGTFTLSSVTNTMSINSLNFKPTSVYVESLSKKTTAQSGQTSLIHEVGFGELFNCFVYYSTMNSKPISGNTSSYSVTCTMNNNGFEITTGSYYFTPNSIRWVAIG